MKEITASNARRLIHGTAEIAFLDVREAGEFGEGHPLFAVPLPYSQLELRIDALVPRRQTKVVLIDGGDGIAKRAATQLDKLGYDDVAVIRGGLAGWSAAGYQLYKGVHVPSKTLGELAEAQWHPRMLPARDLAAWQAEGKDFGFFDTRPSEEYAKMRVPGARCMPNGELAHRLASVATDKPLVLTCAGRTRGIIGAIGLQLAGHEGLVYALENGTQGWALEGLALERCNKADPLPALDSAGLQQSRDRAALLCRRYDIPDIDGAKAAAMLAEEARTTYLFDLRSIEEGAVNPVPAARQVLGGQLVQATDQWVGVQRAQIILACDGGLRGAIAAFWLKQLGHATFVTRVDADLKAIPARPRPHAFPRRVDAIDAASALRGAASGALLVDLRSSRAYKREHVAGAIWSIRPKLAILGPLNDRRVIVIADGMEIANNAAIELAALGARRIDWVEGGHEALVAAGARKVHADSRPSDRDAIDHLFFVHDRHDGNLDACRRYLAWETGLVAQLDAEELAMFDLADVPPAA
jgi:rhodanese-related sulfurtransferase